MRGAVGVAVLAALACSGLALAAIGGPADQGKALFKQNCSSCHTVGGGDGVGPDLKGVVDLAGESAVRAFITDPTKAIAAGDPRIAALVTKFHGLKMPSLGLSAAQIDALVAYLKGQGGGAAPPATTTTAQPATGNAAAGKKLFTGATQLAHGGPACLSCHSIAGGGSLGGGRVGPDLTKAATKYGGAKGLTSVLASIPFPKMVPLYRDHALTRSEEGDLAAFLATTPGKQRSDGSAWLIAALGVGVTAAALALMLVIWPRRRLVVRRRIVPSSTMPPSTTRRT
jgi:mono/diheme cytochrome c family protein